MLEAIRTIIHGSSAERPFPMDRPAGKLPEPGGIRPAATEESCDCPCAAEVLLADAELDTSCGNCCDSNCGCF